MRLTPSKHWARRQSGRSCLRSTPSQRSFMCHGRAFVLGTVQNKCSLQYLEDLVCAMRAVGRQGCSQATAICVQLLSKHHSCDIAVLLVLGTVQNKCSLQYLEDLVCAMRAVGRQGCSQATAICVQLLSKHHSCDIAVFFVLGTVQNKCSLQYLEDLVCYRPEAGSRFRFHGKLCPVPRFQRCQTCQFLVPALGHPLANMSHAGSSKFLTKCMITL